MQLALLRPSSLAAIRSRGCASTALPLKLAERSDALRRLQRAQQRLQPPLPRATRSGGSAAVVTAQSAPSSAVGDVQGATSSERIRPTFGEGGRLERSASFAAALARCRKTGAWREALALLRQFEELGLEASQAEYRSVLIACAAAAPLSSMWAVLEQMRAASVPPDASMLDAFMLGCRRAADVAAAERAWGEMRALGVWPSERGLQNFLWIHARLPEARAGVAREGAPTRAAAAAARPASPERGRERGEGSDVATSQGETVSGWRRALAVLESAAEAGRPTSALHWNTVASGCVASGELDAAEALLARMPHAPTTATFNNLLHGYAQLWASRSAPEERVAKATELLAAMDAAGLARNEGTYNALLDLHRYDVPAVRLRTGEAAPDPAAWESLRAGVRPRCALRDLARPRSSPSKPSSWPPRWRRRGTPPTSASSSFRSPRPRVPACSTMPTGCTAARSSWGWARLALHRQPRVSAKP